MSNPPIEAKSSISEAGLPAEQHVVSGEVSVKPDKTPEGTERASSLGTQTSLAASPGRSSGFGISLFLNDGAVNDTELQRKKQKIDNSVEVKEGTPKSTQPQQQGQQQEHVVLPSQHVPSRSEILHQSGSRTDIAPEGIAPNTTVGPNSQIAFHHGPSMAQGHTQIQHHHHHHHPQQHVLQLSDRSKDVVVHSLEASTNGVQDHSHHSHHQHSHHHNHPIHSDHLEHNELKYQTHKGYKDIDRQAILRIIEEFFPHRRNLGSVVYNPTTTWLTLQTESLVGLKPEHQERFLDIKINFNEQVRYDKREVKYIPVIPPLPYEYVNNTVEVKIPYRYIKIFKELLDHNHEDIKRELWGGAGGVYTDDSDILSILVHKGLFAHTIDLSDWNKTWDAKKDFIRPQLINPATEEGAEEDDDGIYGDLSVEILMLPTLPQYHGFFANGINSRSWTGHDRHDGLSIAVCNIKWESFGSYMRDKSLFKISELELYNDLEVLREQYQHNSWKFDTKLFTEIKKKYAAKSNTSS